jgi:hypothetical protein
MQSVAEANPDPAMITSRQLVLAIAGALLGTAAALSAVLALVNEPSWWRGLFAASIASTLAAVASVLPLVWSLRRGINQRVAGFFMASGLRMIVSLGACLLAINAGRYPAKPTLLLMVVFYFAVLAVEATLVAKSLWNARD